MTKTSLPSFELVSMRWLISLVLLSYISLVSSATVFSERFFFIHRDGVSTDRRTDVIYDMVYIPAFTTSPLPSELTLTLTATCNFDFSAVTITEVPTEWGKDCTYNGSTATEVVIKCAPNVAIAKPTRFALSHVKLPNNPTSAASFSECVTLRATYIDATSNLVTNTFKAALRDRVAVPISAYMNGTTYVDRNIYQAGQLDLALTLRIQFPYILPTMNLAVQVPQAFDPTYTAKDVQYTLTSRTGSAMMDCRLAEAVSTSNAVRAMLFTCVQTAGAITSVCMTEGCIISIAGTPRSNFVADAANLVGQFSLHCMPTIGPNVPSVCPMQGRYELPRPSLPITNIYFLQHTLAPGVSTVLTLRFRLRTSLGEDACMEVKLDQRYLKFVTITGASISPSNPAESTQATLQVNDAEPYAYCFGVASAALNADQYYDLNIGTYLPTTPLTDNIYDTDIHSYAAIRIRKKADLTTIATPVTYVPIPALSPVVPSVFAFTSINKRFQPGATDLSVVLSITLPYDGTEAPTQILKDTRCIMSFDPTQLLQDDYTLSLNLTLNPLDPSSDLVINANIQRTNTFFEFQWPVTTTFENIHYLRFTFNKIVAHSSPVFFHMYIGSVLRVSTTLPVPEELDINAAVVSGPMSISQQIDTSADIVVTCPDAVAFLLPNLQNRMMMNVTFDTSSTLDLALPGVNVYINPSYVNATHYHDQHRMVIQLTRDGLVAVTNGNFVISISSFRAHHDTRPVPGTVVLYLRSLDDADPAQAKRNEWSSFILARSLPFAFPPPDRIVIEGSELFTGNSISCGAYTCTITIRMRREKLCPFVMEGEDGLDAPLETVLYLPPLFHQACSTGSFPNCVSNEVSLTTNAGKIIMRHRMVDNNRAVVAILPFHVRPCTSDFPAAHVEIVFRGIARPPRAVDVRSLPFGWDMRRGHNPRLRVNTFNIDMPGTAAAAALPSTDSDFKFVWSASTTMVPMQREGMFNLTIKINPNAVPLYPSFRYTVEFGSRSGCYMDPMCTTAPVAINGSPAFSFFVDNEYKSFSLHFASNPPLINGLTLRIPCILCAYSPVTTSAADRKLSFKVYDMDTGLPEYSGLTTFTTFDTAARDAFIKYNNPITCRLIELNQPLDTVRLTPLQAEAGKRTHMRCFFTVPVTVFPDQWLNYGLGESWYPHTSSSAGLYFANGTLVSTAPGASTFVHTHWRIRQRLPKDTALYFQYDNIVAPFVTAGAPTPKTPLSVHESNASLLIDTTSAWTIDTAGIVLPMISQSYLSVPPTLVFDPAATATSTTNSLVRGLPAKLILSFRSDNTWDAGFTIALVFPMSLYTLSDAGIDGSLTIAGVVPASENVFAPTTTAIPDASGTTVLLTLAKPVVAGVSHSISLSSVITPVMAGYDGLRNKRITFTVKSGSLNIAMANINASLAPLLPPSTFTASPMASFGALVTASRYAPGHYLPLGASMLARDVHLYLPISLHAPVPAAGALFFTLPHGVQLTAANTPVPAEIQQFSTSTKTFTTVDTVTCTMIADLTTVAIAARHFRDAGIPSSVYGSLASAGLRCTVPAAGLLEGAYNVYIASTHLLRTFKDAQYSLYHASALTTNDNAATALASAPLITFSPPVPFPAQYSPLPGPVLIPHAYPSPVRMLMCPSGAAIFTITHSTNAQSTPQITVSRLPLRDVHRSNKAVLVSPSIVTAGITSVVISATGKFRAAVIPIDRLALYIAIDDTIYPVLINPSTGALTVDTTKTVKVPAGITASHTTTTADTLVNSEPITDLVALGSYGTGGVVIASAGAVVHAYTRSFVDGSLTYTASHSPANAHILSLTAAPTSLFFFAHMRTARTVLVKVAVSTAGVATMENYLRVDLPAQVQSAAVGPVGSNAAFFSLTVACTGKGLYTVQVPYLPLTSGAVATVQAAVNPGDSSLSSSITHVLQPALGTDVLAFNAYGQAVVYLRSAGSDILVRNTTDVSFQTLTPSPHSRVAPIMTPDGATVFYLSAGGDQLVALPAPPRMHAIDVQWDTRAVATSTRLTLKLVPSLYPPLAVSTTDIFTISLAVPPTLDMSSPTLVAGFSPTMSSELKTLLGLTFSVNTTASVPSLTFTLTTDAPSGYASLISSRVQCPDIYITLSGLRSPEIPSEDVDHTLASWFPHRAPILLLSGYASTPSATGDVALPFSSASRQLTMQGFARRTNPTFINTLYIAPYVHGVATDVQLRFTLPNLSPYFPAPVEPIRVRNKFLDGGVQRSEQLVVKMEGMRIADTAQTFNVEARVVHQVDLSTTTYTVACTYTALAQELTCEFTTTAVATILPFDDISFTFSAPTLRKQLSRQAVRVSLLKRSACATSPCPMTALCDYCSNTVVPRNPSYFPAPVVSAPPTFAGSTSYTFDLQAQQLLSLTIAPGAGTTTPADTYCAIAPTMHVGCLYYKSGIAFEGIPVGTFSDITTKSSTVRVGLTSEPTFDSLVVSSQHRAMYGIRDNRLVTYFFPYTTVGADADPLKLYTSHYNRYPVAVEGDVAEGSGAYEALTSGGIEDLYTTGYERVERLFLAQSHGTTHTHLYVYCNTTRVIAVPINPHTGVPESAVLPQVPLQTVTLLADVTPARARTLTVAAIVDVMETTGSPIYFYIFYRDGSIAIMQHQDPVFPAQSQYYTSSPTSPATKIDFLEYHVPCTVTAAVHGPRNHLFIGCRGGDIYRVTRNAGTLTGLTNLFRTSVPIRSLAMHPLNRILLLGTFTGYVLPLRVSHDVETLDTLSFSARQPWRATVSEVNKTVEADVNILTINEHYVVPDVTEVTHLHFLPHGTQFLASGPLLPAVGTGHKTHLLQLALEIQDCALVPTNPIVGAVTQWTLTCTLPPLALRTNAAAQLRVRLPKGVQKVGTVTATVQSPYLIVSSACDDATAMCTFTFKPSASSTVITVANRVLVLTFGDFLNSPLAYPARDDLYVGIWEDNVEYARSNRVTSPAINFHMRLELVPYANSPAEYIPATKVGAVRLVFNPAPTQPSQIKLTISTAAAASCVLSASSDPTTFLSHTITITAPTAATSLQTYLLCDAVFPKNSIAAPVIEAQSLSGDQFPTMSSPPIWVHPFMSFQYDAFLPQDTTTTAQPIPAGRYLDMTVTLSHPPQELFPVTIEQVPDSTHCHFVSVSNHSAIFDTTVTFSVAAATTEYTEFALYCDPTNIPFRLVVSNDAYVNRVTLRERTALGAFELVHPTDFSVLIDHTTITQLEVHPVIPTDEVYDITLRITRAGKYIPDLPCGFLTQDQRDLSDLSLLPTTLDQWSTEHTFSFDKTTSVYDIAVRCDDSVFISNDIELEMKTTFPIDTYFYEIVLSPAFNAYISLSPTIARYDQVAITPSFTNHIYPLGAMMPYTIVFELSRPTFIDTVITIASAGTAQCLFRATLTSLTNVDEPALWSATLDIPIPARSTHTPAIWFHCRALATPMDTSFVDYDHFLVTQKAGDNMGTYTVKHLELRPSVHIYSSSTTDAQLPVAAPVSMTEPSIVGLVVAVFPALVLNGRINLSVDHSPAITNIASNTFNKVKSPNGNPALSVTYESPGGLLRSTDWMYVCATSTTAATLSVSISNSATAYDSFVAPPIRCIGSITASYGNKLFDAAAEPITVPSSQSVKFTYLVRPKTTNLQVEIVLSDSYCTITHAITSTGTALLTPVAPSNGKDLEGDFTISCPVTTNGTSYTLSPKINGVVTDMYTSFASAYINFKAALTVTFDNASTFPESLSTQIPVWVRVNFVELPSRPQTLILSRTSPAGNCGFLPLSTYTPTYGTVYDPTTLPSVSLLQPTITLAQLAATDVLQCVYWCVEPHLHAAAIVITSPTNSAYNAFTPMLPVLGDYLMLYGHHDAARGTTTYVPAIPFHDFFGQVDYAVTPPTITSSPSAVAPPHPYILYATTTLTHFRLQLTPAAPAAVDVTLSFSAPESVVCGFGETKTPTYTLTYTVGEAFKPFSAGCSTVTITPVHIIGRVLGDRPYAPLLTLPITVKGLGVFSTNPADLYPFSPQINSYMQVTFTVTLTPPAPAPIMLDLSIPPEGAPAQCRFFLPTVTASAPGATSITSVEVQDSVQLSLYCTGMMYPQSTLMQFTDAQGYYLPFVSTPFTVFASVWVEPQGQNLPAAPVPSVTIPKVVVTKAYPLSVRINSPLTADETFTVAMYHYDANNVRVDSKQVECYLSLSATEIPTYPIPLEVKVKPNTQATTFYMTCRKQYALNHNVRMYVSPSNTASTFSNYLTQPIAVKNAITIENVPSSLHIITRYPFTVKFDALAFDTVFIVAMDAVNNAQCTLRYGDTGDWKTSHEVTVKKGGVNMSFYLSCTQHIATNPALQSPYITVTDSKAGIVDPTITLADLPYSIFWPTQSLPFTVTLNKCTPQTLVNGTITYTDGGYGEQYYESVATYACDEGHVIQTITRHTNGTSTTTTTRQTSYTRTCDTMAWFPYNTDVYCVPNDCGPLVPARSRIDGYPAGPPVTYNPSTTYKSIATYTCNFGWDIVHTPTFINPLTQSLMPKGQLFCTGSGWSDSTNPDALPSCTPHECPQLEEISDSLSISYEADPYKKDDNIRRYGVTATYQCAEGFVMQGTNKRTCGAVAWSGTEPSCVPSECRTLSTIAQGQPPTYSAAINPSTQLYAAGTVATYACVQGYYLNDMTREKRECDVTGWKGKPPVCLPQACPQLSTIEHGSISQFGGAGTNLLGSVATYRCDKGYRITIAISGQVLTQTTRTCDANQVTNSNQGSWSGTESDYVCRPSKCNAVVTPVDAISVAYVDAANAPVAAGNILYGSKAIYTCKTGYNLVGGKDSNDYRFCDDSAWDPVADPTCQINNCGPLPLTPGLNLTVSFTTTTYNSVATYKCTTGFDVVSQDGSPHTGRRTCGTKTQGWLGTEPRCVPHDCGAITTLSDLNMDYIVYKDAGYGQYKLGATATMICKAGYSNNASTFQTCGATGWTGRLGTCVDINECAATGVNSKCAKFGSQARCLNTDGSYICPPYVLPDTLSYLGNSDGTTSAVTIGQNKRITVPDVYGGQIIEFQIFEGFNNRPLGDVLPAQRPNNTLSTYADGGVGLDSVLSDVSFKNMDGWITSNTLSFGCNNLRVVDSGMRMSQKVSSIAAGSAGDLRIFTVTCTTQPGTGSDLYLRLHYCAPPSLDNSPVCTFINLDRSKWSEPKDTAALASVNYGYHLAYPSPMFVPNTVYSVSYSTEKSSSYVFMTSAAESIGVEVTNLFVARNDLVSVYYGPPANPTQYKAPFNQLLSLTLTNPVRVLVFSSITDGKGTYMPITLTLANSTIRSTDVISYPQTPTVTSITGCPARQGAFAANCPTDGLSPAGTDVLLTVVGSDLYEPLSAYINGRQCPIKDIIGTTSFTCVLPSGIGRNHALVLQSSLMRTSVPAAVSYSEPVIEKVTGCASNLSPTHVFDCDRTGGQIITVEGRNFGSLGVTVSIDYLPCTEVTQNPTEMHSKFTCKLPAAVGGKLPIRIQQKYGLVTTTATGLVSYVQCEKGYFNDGLYCSQCPAGTYAPGTGHNYCLPCPAGTYNANVGASECAPCAAGSSSIAQSASCSLCAVGKFAPSGGGSCLVCAPNTYAPQPGTNKCLACPENAQNTIDYSFCECRAGFYMDATGRCVPCLEGGNCLRTGTSLYTMDSLPGYYSAIAPPKEPASMVRFRYLVMAHKLHTAIQKASGSTALEAMVSAVQTYMDELVAANADADTMAKALVMDLPRIVTLDEDVLRSTLMSVLYSFPWLPKHRVAVAGFVIERHNMSLSQLARVLTRQTHINAILPIVNGTVVATTAATDAEADAIAVAGSATSSLLGDSTPGSASMHTAASWPPPSWPSMQVQVTEVRLELSVHPGTSTEESAVSLASRLETATTIMLSDATDPSAYTLAHAHPNGNAIVAGMGMAGATGTSARSSFYAAAAFAPVDVANLYTPVSYSGQYYFHLSSGGSLVPEVATQPAVEFKKCSGSACLGGDTCNAGYSGVLCSVCVEGYSKHSPFKCVECSHVALRYIYYMLSIVITIAICAFLSWKQIADSRVMVDELPAPALPMVVKVTFSGIQVMAFASRYDAEWPYPLSGVLDVLHVIGNLGTYVTTLDCFVGQDTDLALIWVNSLAIMVLPLVAIVLPLMVWIPRYYAVRASLERKQTSLLQDKEALDRLMAREYVEYVKQQRKLQFDANVEQRRRARLDGLLHNVWDDTEDNILKSGTDHHLQEPDSERVSMPSGAMSGPAVELAVLGMPKTVASPASPSPLPPPPSVPLPAGGALAWGHGEYDDSLVDDVEQGWDEHMAFAGVDGESEEAGEGEDIPREPSLHTHTEPSPSPSSSQSRSRSGVSMSGVSQSTQVESVRMTRTHSHSEEFSRTSTHTNTDAHSTDSNDHNDVSTTSTTSSAATTAATTTAAVPAAAAVGKKTKKVVKVVKKRAAKKKLVEQPTPETAQVVEAPQPLPPTPPLQVSVEESVPTLALDLPTPVAAVTPMQESARVGEDGEELDLDLQAAVSTRMFADVTELTKSMVHDALHLNDHPDTNAKTTTADTNADDGYESDSLSEEFEHFTTEQLGKAEKFRAERMLRVRAEEEQVHQAAVRKYTTLYGPARGKKLAEEEWQTVLRGRRTVERMLGVEMRHAITTNERRLASVHSEFIGYLVTSIGVIMFVIHANITRQVALMLACKDISADMSQMHLLADLRIRCFSTEHTILLVAVALPVLAVWVIGLPLLAFVALYRNRGILLLAHYGFLSTTQRARRATLDARLGFLYRGYHARRYYWFLVDLLKRAILICIPVFCPARIHTQLLLASGVIIVFIVIQVLCRPYEHEVVDKLEFYSLFACFFVYFMANMLFAETVSTMSEDILQILILIVIAAFVAVAIACMWHVWRREQDVLPLRYRLLEAYSRGANTAPIINEWMGAHDHQDTRQQKRHQEQQQKRQQHKKKRTRIARYRAPDENNVHADQMEHINTEADVRSGVVRMLDAIGRAQKSSIPDVEENAFVQDGIILHLDQEEKWGAVGADEEAAGHEVYGMMEEEAEGSLTWEGDELVAVYRDGEYHYADHGSDAGSVGAGGGRRRGSSIGERERDSSVLGRERTGSVERRNSIDADGLPTRLELQL